MSERAVALHIEGRVQGVGFRAFTRNEAGRLGVGGWVANRDDGSVEVALHGPGQALADLIGLLRKGPPGADVRKLDVRSISRGTIDEVPAEGYAF